MGLSSKVNENQFQIINGVLDRLIKEQDLKLEKKDKSLSEISSESKSKIGGLLKIRNNITSKFSKEQQLSINSKNTETLIGNYYFTLGKYNDANLHYDTALKLDPSFVEPLFNKGLSLSKLGKHDDAITCYNEALKIDPNNSEIIYSKGNSLSTISQHEEAIMCYDKNITIRSQLL